MSYQQQPQAVANMAVPPQTEQPRQVEGPQEFKHGLCGCGADLGTFCVSWFCPCITYGRLKSIQEKNPDPGCCNSNCMIHGLLTCCGFGFVLQFILRGDIRRQYQIEGGACSDCLTAFCCTPCELTQESLQLEIPPPQPQYGKT